MSKEEKPSKKNLDNLKQVLDYLYDIDMLSFILEDQIFDQLYSIVDKKYLVDADPNDSSAFSEDDDVVETIERIPFDLGENFVLGIKDGEYYLLTSCGRIDDMKYWSVSKIRVNDLETAKKVGSLLRLLNDM
jgi:hypothetical protein